MFCIFRKHLFKTEKIIRNFSRMAQKDDRILLLNAPRLPLEDDKLNELTADLHDWAHVSFFLNFRISMNFKHLSG